MKHALRSQANPVKPLKHLHFPRFRSHTPLDEHSSCMCALFGIYGFAFHAVPEGHEPDGVCVCVWGGGGGVGGGGGGGGESGFGGEREASRGRG